ncbi:hypothetical protein SAMN05421733_10574 [Acinetobacter boissieri]|uniref:Uncharacterized protein n=1 Tax=Acinetobacter boissieri TaxID=1219383 RepID=A0A1G6HEQ5_9GAMM|nr:hypothetical protein SAMN05421733_10574 [Acinetobacter boissieri]
MSGGQVIHMVPPVNQAPRLISVFLQWLGASQEYLLIQNFITGLSLYILL